MVVKGNGGSALQVQRPDVQRCHEHTPWGNDGRLVLHNHRMLDLETMWLDLGWLPLNGMNTVPIFFHWYDGPMMEWNALTNWQTSERFGNAGIERHDFSLVWWPDDGMECIDQLTMSERFGNAGIECPDFSLVWWTNDGMECIEKLMTNVRIVWECRN